MSYNVEEIWQIPPPIPSTTCPFEYILASLYPFSIVLAPTILLYENISPGAIIVSFIFSAASSKLVDLSDFVILYLVVKNPRVSLKKYWYL